MSKVFTLQVSDAKNEEEFRLETKGDPTLYLEDVSLDHICAPNHTTLRNLVALLCDGPVRKRRRLDWNINEHMWELRVIPPGEPMEADPMEMLRANDDDDKQCREACVGPERNEYEESISSEWGLKYIDPDDTLGSLSSLKEGADLRLRYDFGTTTEVYLRCVKVEEKDTVDEKTKESAHYITLQPPSSASLPTLESIPAYSYPPERRLDSFYPTFAARFLCNTSTLGLSCRITRDDDSSYCTIEKPRVDTIFCPLPFDEVDDLFVVADDCLDRRQEDSFLIFPPTDKGAQLAREAIEEYESDPFAMYMTSPRAYISKSREQIDAMKANTKRKRAKEGQEQEFEFSKAFPKTYAQFTSGKFRWIRYKPGNRMRDAATLKVVVGRAKGDRKAPLAQVTRTWKRAFKDLHELFCAVEASWIWPTGYDRAGQELAVDAFVPEHDADLGPSKPLPPDPPVVADQKDAVVMIKPEKESPEITALAIAEVGSKPFLFTGDSKGEVKIFDMENNDNLEEIDYTYLATHGHENCGVRGLQIYYNAEEKRTTVYAWMYPGENYDEEDEDNDGLLSLLSFDLKIQEDGDGIYSTDLVAELFCERRVEDLKGYFYDPMIAALVIVPARVDGKWVDTIFIGIEGQPVKRPRFAEDFSDYNLATVQANGPSGNILPVIEADHQVYLESWRGHEGCIRALAAIPTKYLVSLGVVGGMEWPGQLILWSLLDFGTPLHRIDLFLEDRSISEYPPITGMPGGLCIHDEKIVLWGDYGDTIVPIDIEEGRKLKMKGCIRLGQHSDFGLYLGYMASPPGCKHGAIIHAGEERAWIFDISKVGDDPALDKDLSSKHCSDCDGDEWRDTVLVARGMAVAQVKIPEKRGPNDAKNRRERYADDSGVKVIAMNGKWLVTGQGNGALVKMKLPEELNGKCGKTSGLLNSSSWSMPQD